MPHKSRFTSGLLNQTAVYWGNPTPNGEGGYSYDAPVEISCRWELRQELIRDDVGRELRSKARIFVGQDLDDHGYLYLGDLDDLDSDEQVDPATVTAAFEIKMKEEVPDIKGARPVRVVWLG